MSDDVQYGYFDKQERKMHDIVCSDCGKEAQVPFKPDGVRPVYCQDCYKKRKPRRY